jgi:hypothetical protein
MNAQNLLLRQLMPSDRRSAKDRRFIERRHLHLSVPVDRRAAERRSGIDRRESPLAHLRNALQVLHELRARLGTDPDSERDITMAIRRVVLAVADLERRRQ